MTYSNEYKNRNVSKVWSAKIAGNVIKLRRKKRQQKVTMYSVILLVILAVPIISGNILGGFGWDDYLNSWLQQEESTFDLTQEEYANLINY